MAFGLGTRLVGATLAPAREPVIERGRKIEQVLDPAQVAGHFRQPAEGQPAEGQPAEGASATEPSPAEPSATEPSPVESQSPPATAAPSPSEP